MDGFRRIFLLVALGAPSLSASADTSQPSAPAAVAAFARLYGVVRYYYPGDAIQALDWNRFAIYGVSQVEGAHDSRALARDLRKLFDPLASGIVILADDQPFPAAKPLAPNRPQVYWQRLGYATGVNRYAAYQAKRTDRAGVFVVTNHAPGVDIERERSASESMLAPDATLFDAAPPSYRYAEFPLGAGLKARVPIDLSDEEAKATPAQQAAVAALATRPAAFDEDTISADQRLADIVVSWNVYRHFYPYWREVGGDWNSQLEPLLATAGAPASRDVQHGSLNHLVALAQDGHGFVYDGRSVMGGLPLMLEPVGGGLAVTASIDPSVHAGDRIVSINGVAFDVWATSQLSQLSGSPQWKRWRLAHTLNAGPAGTSVTLGLERDDQKIEAALTYQSEAIHRPSPPRPDPVAELKQGVWYLDITRASLQDLNKQMEQLAKARAVIVDLRGYPTPNTGIQLLRHLLPEPEHARWMHLPKYNAPFDRPIGYVDLGWDIQPVAPRIAGKIMVLMDGRAISQAESILGYFGDMHLATIVGSPSAGTNGDVQQFTTPSGYRISFTGLRVTHHDGVTPFHLQGTMPDVTVEPSLQDIRADRDIVLDQAINLCQ